jgi:hypothetical protein
MFKYSDILRRIISYWHCSRWQNDGTTCADRRCILHTAGLMQMWRLLSPLIYFTYVKQYQYWQICVRYICRIAHCRHVWLTRLQCFVKYGAAPIASHFTMWFTSYSFQTETWRNSSHVSHVVILHSETTALTEAGLPPNKYSTTLQ